MGRSTNGKNGEGDVRPTKSPMRISPAPKSLGGGQQAGVNKGSSVAGKPSSDRSQLNFPYDIRLASYASLNNAVTNGTPRIRRILTEECDYIMECRVCRNLFRSLPNFITHKLNYCKKVFDSTWSIGLSNLIQTSDISYNIEYEVDPELLLDDSCSSNPNNNRSVADLYSEIAMKAQHRKPCGQPSTPSSTNENDIRLLLKPLVEVPGGTVVLQQRVSSDPSNCDISSAHMNRDQIARKDTALLGPDGMVMCTGSSKRIEQIVSRLSARRMRQVEEKQAQLTSATSITCDICKTVFESEKSLRQHKRESLDCGRTWGFKSPNGDSTMPMNPSTEDSITSKNVQETPPGDSKHASTAARRQSLKGTSRSPGMSKRSFSLSPVKRIKLKYSKLDWSVANNFEKDEGKFQCGKCTRSFSTKEEVTVHSALCPSAAIDLDTLQNNDPQPPAERIRISARNEFAKPPPPSPAVIDLKDYDECSPNKRSKLVTTMNESPAKTPKARENGRRKELTEEGKVKEKRRISAKSKSSPKAIETPEVNNNRQFVNESSHSSSAAIGVSENFLSNCQESSAATRPPKLNGIIGIIGLHGGVSSPTPAVQKKMESDVVNLKSQQAKLPESPNKSKTKTKSNSANLDQVSTRLGRNHHLKTPSGKSCNLRVRAASSRVRTSSRGLEHHHERSSQLKLFERKTRKFRQSFTNVTRRGIGKTF